MMALPAYPRVSAYVAAMGIRQATGMQPKHYAWLAADAALSTEDLDEIGAGDVPLEKWDELLPDIGARMGRADRKRQTSKARAKLNAWFGAWGIKTKRLKSDDDWWSVAAILWPGEINRLPGANQKTLHDQIAAMSKAKRRRLAWANVRNVPDHLFGPSSEDH